MHPRRFALFCFCLFCLFFSFTFEKLEDSEGRCIACPAVKTDKGGKEKGTCDFRKWMHSNMDHMHNTVFQRVHGVYLNHKGSSSSYCSWTIIQVVWVSLSSKKLLRRLAQTLFIYSSRRGWERKDRWLIGMIFSPPTLRKLRRFDSFCRLTLFPDVTLFTSFDWVNSRNNVRELRYFAYF